jgi:uncharacterized protein YjeT (DUF2065 family)
VTALLALLAIAVGAVLLAVITGKVACRVRAAGLRRGPDPAAHRAAVKGLVRATEARVSLVGTMLVVAGCTALAVMAVLD